MKLQTIFIILLCIFFQASFADILVVGKQVFDLSSRKILDCGVPATSLAAADTVVINTAKSAGELVARASCAAGEEKYCAISEQKKFGLENLFTTIRGYPSKFRSDGCFALRDKCTKLCVEEAIMGQEDCRLECNQYESFNK